VGKILKGLSATIIAIIAVIVIVVAAVGIYYGITLSRPTKTTVVFYTWWATTGKVALNHEISAFESAYPQYVVTTEIVPGGAGSNAVPAILSLIKAGKPPDAFQALYGPEMFSFVSAYPGGVSAGLKAFVNWTSYYYSNLSGEVIPEVFEAGAFNGTLLSMPTQVHTSGLLYINIKVLKHYGLPIPSNISELINDTLQLVKDGFYNSTNAPWGIGGAEDGWEGSLIWEDIFLALGGPKLYNEFEYGTLPLSDPNVMQIINETNTIFALFNKYNLPGWETMTWTQMAEELVSGHIAFFVNLDSTTNYMYDFYNTTSYPALPQYLNNPNVTVVVKPFPGTQNYIVMVIDSVGIPTTSVSPPLEKAAITFVEYWTSPAGDKIWTKWKGESYYLNMPTSYYNTPEQTYMYERLINASSNPSDFVYDLTTGGLFVTPRVTLESAILNFQEGVYNYAQLVQAINQTLNTEEESWLSAAKYGLGYLGFPEHPFGNYLPPWVNSTNGDGPTYNNANTNVNSMESNHNDILSNLKVIINTNNVQINQIFIAPTVTTTVTTTEMSSEEGFITNARSEKKLFQGIQNIIRKIFNL